MELNTSKEVKDWPCATALPTLYLNCFLNAENVAGVGFAPGHFVPNAEL